MVRYVPSCNKVKKKVGVNVINILRAHFSCICAHVTSYNEHFNIVIGKHPSIINKSDRYCKNLKEKKKRKEKLRTNTLYTKGLNIYE